MTVTSDHEEITYDEFPVTMLAVLPGEYTITQTLASGEEAIVDFYVRIAENQSDFYHDYGVLSDPIIPNTTENVETNKDTIDIIYYLMGVLLVLLLIEWGIHYNEHY